MYKLPPNSYQWRQQDFRVLQCRSDCHSAMCKCALTLPKLLINYMDL